MSSSSEDDSDDSEYSLLFSGSTSDDLVALMRKKFLKSPKFLKVTHPQLQRCLKTVFGVGEYDLFRGIIRWATKKFQDSVPTAATGMKPSIFDLKKVIAPTGQEDLMKEIRIGLFNENDWVKVFSSQEALLLPLSLYDKAVFDNYFAASEAEKRLMETQKDLEGFSFQRRKRVVENGNPRRSSRGASVSETVSANSSSRTENQPISISQSGLLCLVTDNSETVSANSSSRTENQPISISQSGLLCLVTDNSGQTLTALSEIEIPRCDVQSRGVVENSPPRSLVTFTYDSSSGNNSDSLNSSDSRLEAASSSGSQFRSFRDFRPTMENAYITDQPSLIYVEHVSSDTVVSPETTFNALVRGKEITAPLTSDSLRKPSKRNVAQTSKPEVDNLSDTSDMFSEDDGDLFSFSGRTVSSGLKKQASRKRTSEAPLLRTRNNASVPGKKRPAALSSERPSKEARRSDAQHVDEPQPSTTGQLGPVNIEGADVQNRNLTSDSPPSTARRMKPDLPEFEAVSSTFSEYINNKVNCDSRRISVEFVVRDYIKGLGLDSIVRRVIPNLEQYHLKFTFMQLKLDKESEKRYKNFITSSIDLNKYLCFTISDSRVALQNLWSTNVNLSIEFHGCVIIKMNHESKELVLNCPRNCEDILSSVNDAPLKKIALSCCGFAHPLNFKEVEVLVLYAVKGETKFDDVLSKCPSLVELCLYKNENSLEPVDLSLIPNPSKLKWLALCRTDLFVLNLLRTNTSFTNLETLHLNYSTYSSELLIVFPTIFPRIKKLSIGELTDRSGKGISLQFVVAVLKIPTLCWVRVGKMNWNQKNSKGVVRTIFKNMTGLNDSTKTSFILTKRNADGNDRVWNVELLNDKVEFCDDAEGGYFEKMDEQAYEFYKLDNFYKPFSSTDPAWLTFGHFAIPFGE